MKATESDEVRRRWVEVRRGECGGAYASIKPTGEISIGGNTHRKMGSPTHYVLMFDNKTRALGLRAAMRGEERQAFKALRRNSKGAYRGIRAAAFLRSARLLPKETIVFNDCPIERGVLVLEIGARR
ncbi:MAG: hypothetical protein IPM50_12035 [Acidobacteriota bacterium]|nr:MAG: hypothetical protein IPM50_12035 [Acidobacteriota bacterium]